MPALFRAATRTVRNGLMDSTYWDRYEPRADDIVIATYPKCGTTWTQRIVDLLVFQSTAPREFLAASPWLDATFFAPIEANLELLAAQKHRRFIKSHLPFDALPVYEGVKYIHVARDGRDSCMSMHNHQLGFVPEIRERIAAMAPEGAPRQTVPEDPRAYFLQWIGEAEGPRRPGADAPFFEFETTYWRERQAPHLLLVHYNDLKADLAGEMRRIADFLAIETPPAKLAELAAAATFDSMKRDGDVIMPQLRMAFDRGADRFINKGTNGRWREVLTADDIARYEALACAKFTPSCAAWIEHGRLVAGDPTAAPN